MLQETFCDTISHVTDTLEYKMDETTIIPDTTSGMDAKMEMRFSENSGMLLFTAICAFIIAILGTFGNVLTIVSLLMSKKLKSSATMYVVNLALAELIFCLVILPISGAQYAYLQDHNDSLIGDEDCVIFAATRYTITQAELQTIVAIALTRALAVGSPKVFQKVNSDRFTMVYIAVIWIYSFLLKLPPILGTVAEYKFNPLTMECDLSTESAIYRLFSLVVEALLPILVIFILYIYIFVKVRKSSNRVRKASHRSASRSISVDPSEVTEPLQDRKTSSSSMKGIKRMISDSSLGSRFARRSSSITHCINTNRRDVRLARTIFVIFFMILICSLPVMILHGADREVEKPTRFLAVHILYWVQYCLNTAVYVLMNRQYREAYIDCIGKILPSINKHRNFTFPWENPSMSSKPAMTGSSFRSKKDSISADPKPVTEYKKSESRPQGRLSAIVEANTSSCASEDDVFKEDNIPSTATTSNTDEAHMAEPQKEEVNLKITDEAGSNEEKEVWVNQEGHSEKEEKIEGSRV